LVIGTYAFSYCSDLTTVFIGESVELINSNAFVSCPSLQTVSIGESVRAIRDYVFSYCNSLKKVYYQGSAAILNTNVFSNDASSLKVCASLGYEASKFCGYTPSTNGCEDFQNKFDQCHKGALDQEGHIVQERKKKAEEWELKRNNCTEYKCIDDVGLLSWNLCNSTTTEQRMCVEKQCVDAKTAIDFTKPYVEVEFSEPVLVSEVDPGEILYVLRVDFGVETQEVTVAVEGDDQGHVIRLLFFVPDKELAGDLSDALNKMKDEGIGIMSRAKSVKIVAWSQIISGSSKIKTITLFFIITLFLTIMF